MAPSRTAAAATAVLLAVSGCSRAAGGARTGAAAAPRTIVSLIQVVAAGFALVAVRPAPDAVPQAGARLLAGAAAGDAFRDIGPALPAGALPDDVFFLDSRHGWFATSDAAGGAERLYRTADGGATWRSSVAPHHSLAAGSRDELDFVSPSTGWLADIQPTAPSEALYRTTDGGATWHPVTDLVSRQLPGLGPVRFAPDGVHGWFGGDGAPLYRTDDGGRSWHRSPPGAGPAGIRVPARLGEATTSFAGAGTGTGWAATLEHGSVAAYRTTDGGRTWSRLRTPVVHTAFRPDIQAASGEDAWLLVPGGDGPGTRLYATTDAGVSWVRIDRRATG